MLLRLLLFASLRETRILSHMNRASFLHQRLARVGMAVWLVMSASAGAKELRVRVVGLSTNAGIVRYEVYDSRASYEQRSPRLTGERVPSDEVAEFELRDLAEQPFVVRVFHDENGNGKLDRSPLGVPEEPVGFSRNARARFGPPAFDEAAIYPGDDTYETEIRLIRPLSTDWQVGAGVALIYKQSPYVGGGYQFWPIPNIAYVGRRLSIFGPRASWLLTGGDRWRLSAVGQVRFDALDPEENDELEGMDKRDATWEMGLRWSWSARYGFEGSVGALSDVLGKHNGQEVNVELGRTFRWRDWRFTPGVKLTWMSPNLAGYYYGVSESEQQLPHRPQYDPGSAWSLTPSIRFFYEGAYPWVFTGAVGVEYLGASLAASPIVAERAPWVGFLGVARQFGPGAKRNR